MNDAELIAAGLGALTRKLRREGVPSYSDPRRVLAVACLRLHDSYRETMLAYLLDHDRRLLEVEEIGVGSRDQIALSRFHLARRAAVHGAEYAILAHNHPAADPTPSQADIDTADVIDRQLAAIGVMVLGHYVIARGGVADIRTGQVIRLEDLGEHPSPTETEPPTGPRCPHCGGAVTT